MIVVLLALAGCPRRSSEELGLGPTPDRLEVRATEPLPSPVPSPGTWVGAGLAVDVPEGWTGREGRGSGLVLALQRADGIAIELWSFAPEEGIPFPRPRSGCAPLFTDHGVYRSLPGLAVTATSSCVPEEASGVVIEGFLAEVGGRQLHIDVLVPSDRVVEAREVTAPILASIRASEAR